MAGLCKGIANMDKGIENENRYRILEGLTKGSLAVGAITKKVNTPTGSITAFESPQICKIGRR